MTNVTMKQLLESGVHFGHQTRRWNPKMARYIFGQRNGIYIIDLKKTVRLLKEACRFIRDIAADGGTVLFIGTKKQAQDTVKEEASRCDQFYVNQRWLGGTMTNYQTLQRSIQKLKDLDEQLGSESTAKRRTKKERHMMSKTRDKLQKNLAGIRNMDGLPSVLFVTDIRKDRLSVLEARRIGIPVVAIVDTNCDPDEIDYVIPGNDDAIRAVRLISSKIADAVIEGRMAAAEGGEEESEEDTGYEYSTSSETTDTGQTTTTVTEEKTQTQPAEAVQPTPPQEETDSTPEPQPGQTFPQETRPEEQAIHEVPEQRPVESAQPEQQTFEDSEQAKDKEQKEDIKEKG